MCPCSTRCTCTQACLSVFSVCVPVSDACRYQRWVSEALLPACNSNLPPREDEIPGCPSCASPRKFEFQVSRITCGKSHAFLLLHSALSQVLPQLLNFITTPSLQGLDFSSLYVYTCTASCGRGPGKAKGLSVGLLCSSAAWLQVSVKVGATVTR